VCSWYRPQQLPHDGGNQSHVQILHSTGHLLRWCGNVEQSAASARNSTFVRQWSLLLGCWVRVDSGHCYWGAGCVSTVVIITGVLGACRQWSLLLGCWVRVDSGHYDWGAGCVSTVVTITGVLGACRRPTFGQI
jgi:hypothetical protein